MGRGADVFQHANRVLRELDAMLAGSPAAILAHVEKQSDALWQSLFDAADSTPYSKAARELVLGELRRRVSERRRRP